MLNYKKGNPDLVEKNMRTFTSQEELKTFVEAAISGGNKPLSYIKTALVSLRRAKDGEVIETKMKNGLSETVNTAQKGDFIATNPDGEEYIVKSGQYEPSSNNPSLHRSTAGIQQFIRIAEDIEFPTSWGEKMTITAGGFLNVTHLHENKIYGIQKEEFFHTYSPCDKKGNILTPFLRKASFRS
jgi:hypothetical protein